MRWQEFKLVENKQTEQFKIKKAETHLDALVDGTKDLPDDDPIKDKIIKKLSGIDSAIQNFITKIKGEVAKTPEPAVTEEVSTKNDELEAVKQSLFNKIAGLDELYDFMKNEEGKALLEKQIAELDAALYEAFLLMSKERKELITKLNIATEKANEVENFFKGLLPLLRRLGNKVNDYTELTPEELEAMTGTERSRAKKRAVNAGKFAQTLAEAMSGKVLKLLSEGKTDTAKIKSFLNACLDGKVIKLDDMIKMNQGNIDDYVNQTFEQDYQNFVKENIFSYNPGATSGAIGPGELALAMLGDPASKATSGGDLFIGKGADRKLYEIKAGKGTSGGRMNSKQIVKYANRTYRYYQQKERPHHKVGKPFVSHNYLMYPIP